MYEVVSIIVVFLPREVSRWGGGGGKEEEEGKELFEYENSKLI